MLEERWLSSDLASREAAAGPPDAWKANELVVRRDVAQEDEKGVEGLVKEIVKAPGWFPFTLVVALAVGIWHRAHWRAAGMIALAGIFSGSNWAIKWIVEESRV